MRKIVILCLLALLLLNVAGYYGVFLTLNFKHAQFMLNQFDGEEYDPSLVYTIKVPFTMAYPVQDNGYERVNGEFQYNGEFYRLIKQRHFQDTLYIVCIKDEHRKDIQHALNDYVKTFTDQQTDTKSDAKVKIDFIKDYLGSKTCISHTTEGWSYTLSSTHWQEHSQHTFLSILSPPPEANSNV